MNILFISFNLYPCNTGGAEIFDYYLIRAISRHYKTFVMSHCNKNIGNDVIRIRLFKLISKKISFSGLQCFINILLLRKQVDLIHVNYTDRKWFLWLIFPFLKRMFGVPYIVTIHGGKMHSWRPHIVHKIFFAHAASIIAVSQRIKDEYQKRTNRKIEMVAPLVPFRKCADSKSVLRGRYGFKINDKIIISVGSMKKPKGSDIILNAFIKIEKEYIKKHNLKLIYAGRDFMKKELQRQVKKNNLEWCIKFFGKVEYERIHELYKMADMYITASFVEGNSISLLEAFFNGLVIIGADSVGINDVIKDEENGLLFEAGNVNQLKEQIQRMVEDEALSQKICENARKFYALNYNFEDTIKAYLNILRTISHASN